MKGQEITAKSSDIRFDEKLSYHVLFVDSIIDNCFHQRNEIYTYLVQHKDKCLILMLKIHSKEYRSYRTRRKVNS